jgi:hypothetical protein
VLDFSASNNSINPSVPRLLPELSENGMKSRSSLLLTLNAVRVVFDLSTSANLIAPSLPISLPVLE